MSKKHKLSRVFLAVISAIFSVNAHSSNISDGQTLTIDTQATDTLTNVGYISEGTLIVTSGGEFTTNYLSAGRNGGHGVIEVINGGVINVSNSQYANPFSIGGSSDSSDGSPPAFGSLIISGEGSIVTYNPNNTSIDVGAKDGSGYISILDGGKLIDNGTSTSFGGVWIGSRTSAGSTTSGSVVIDGVDSELWSAARIIVGTYSYGTLSVTNGGKAHTANNINIGNQPETRNYDNTLTVSGTGSTVEAGTLITIGLNGKGTAVAADEGTLSAQEIRIASGANSIGELAVGARAGEAAASAGIIDTQKIVFGSGSGVLNLNHTSSDFTLAADISGNGTINALSGVSTLSGDNSAYQGNFNIDAPATLIISDQKNIGTNAVSITGGTLAIDATQNWEFINTLAGQGTLSVDTGGNNFDFNSSPLTDAFSGILALKDTVFSLAGTNTAALRNVILNLGAESVTKVGDGQQNLKGLVFDGGTLIFGDVTPGKTVSDNTIFTTGTLDISGQGTVQINTGSDFSNVLPTPGGTIPLLAQDDGNILVQLASGDSVTGSGGNLSLTDQNGNIISNGGAISDITQNGMTVAQGTYDYRLTGGDNSDGLYVNYGLTQVELLGQENNALVLTSEGRVGSSADLSAKLTGAGDLAIDTGEGNTVSLSNLENDYTGTTDIRSGTLLMQNDNVLGSTALLQMAQNTGLEMNGYSQTVERVDISKDALVSLDGGNLNINQGGLINGELTGSGTLALNSGTLEVDGSNESLSADVTIAEITTVNLNSVQGLGTGSLDLAGRLNMTDAEGSMANDLSNSGTLALNASQVKLTGNNSEFNGIFTVDADSNLMASNAAHLGDAAVQNEGLLTLSTDEYWQLNNSITGSGDLRKEGIGTVALGVNSTLYTGTTDILHGGLTFGAGDNSATLASSQVNIFEGGSLAGNGTVSGSISNQGILQVGASPAESVSRQALMSTFAAASTDILTINGSLTNSGFVRLARVSDTAQAGNQLVINGDYTGNEGHLIFNTVLNDDASTTDHMSVAGDTTGTTSVSVSNAGGSGAQTLEGIELINVGGRSDGEFIQDGRIVAGAYDYSLVRGEGSAHNNWYLTSMTEMVEPGEPSEPGTPGGESQLRPEMGSYIANNLAANTLFMTRLHDRLGETQYTDILTGERKVTSMWMRNAGGHTRFKDGSGHIGTQSNRYILQIGGDVAQWSTDGLDRWHLGVMGGYANSQSRSKSNLTGYTSRGQVNGYSTGLYGTWYSNDADKSGMYVDTWMLYNWFDNTVSGQGQATEKYKSRGITASLETGYSLKLAQRNRDSYWIQPKAQLVWMDVQADNHQEQNGTMVKDDTDSNLMTRLGIKGYINGRNAIDDNNDRTFQPFIEVNWIHNTHNSSVTMNDVRNEMRGAKNIGEVKAGVEGQITSRLNLWGNVAQQVGDQGYSDTQGMVGIKYVW
ncbi:MULTISPECIES: autotransporter outer membrane beta-barrel domain-containing protein [Citrobacter]|uniref:autotransporter outer membrane beta-barrel domain-containing protein n=1 Tax=Citrobacter TaxID=544 RepID=UPI0018FF3438|nr:autotransporter outer membrane beta-barrel domain-containing protein [Citrobacter sp. Ce119]MBJ9266562.1 autotransporter outer membrane beta-barrel domain-containing protein [Citrobacter freundii]MDM3274759.1 autotransporter outer membrane beta-barrel domain-containing protein [Citrobacter sp. Ce119]